MTLLRKTPWCPCDADALHLTEDHACLLPGQVATSHPQLAGTAEDRDEVAYGCGIHSVAAWAVYSITITDEELAGTADLPKQF